MDHASFWHFAEHFWYGWWPYVPLTLIIAVGCAIVLVLLVRDATKQYHPEEKRWSVSPWRWQAIILAAVLGLGLWPLAIVFFVVIAVLTCMAEDSSHEEDE